MIKAHDAKPAGRTPAEIAAEVQMLLKLTESQRGMILASEPDHITGDDGAGVELRGSGDYAVARSLLRKGLGYIDTPSFTTCYFNNAVGLECRAMIAARPHRGGKP